MYYSNPCKREKRLWHSNAIFFYLKKNLHESENVRVNAFFLPEKKMADPIWLTREICKHWQFWLCFNMGDEIKHLRELETSVLSVTPKKSTDQSNDQGKVLGV